MGLSWEQLQSLMYLRNLQVAEPQPEQAAPCVLEQERRHREARERVLVPRVREMCDKGWIE